MVSLRGRNSEIQGYILIVGGDFFFALALKSALVLTHLPGTDLAKPFEGAYPKLSINFEEILSSSHGNFEEQNKVLDPSILYLLRYYY